MYNPDQKFALHNQLSNEISILPVRDVFGNSGRKICNSSIDEGGNKFNYELWYLLAFIASAKTKNYSRSWSICKHPTSGTTRQHFSSLNDKPNKKIVVLHLPNHSQPAFSITECFGMYIWEKIFMNIKWSEYIQYNKSKELIHIYLNTKYMNSEAKKPICQVTKPIFSTYHSTRNSSVCKPIIWRIKLRKFGIRYRNQVT